MGVVRQGCSSIERCAKAGVWQNKRCGRTWVWHNKGVAKQEVWRGRSVVGVTPGLNRCSGFVLLFGQNQRRKTLDTLTPFSVISNVS